MYGLNYHGATQVWDMAEEAKKKGYNFNSEDIQKKIEELKKDPKYLSDSEELQTAINKMTDNLVKIGEFKFNATEWGVLDKQAKDVEKILAGLGGKEVDPMPGISEEVMRRYSGGGGQIGEAAVNTIKNFKPADDTTGMDEYQRLRERYEQIIDGVDPGLYPCRYTKLSHFL